MIEYRHYRLSEARCGYKYKKIPYFRYNPQQSATRRGPPIMAYRNNKENYMILNIKWVGT
jgi:hypothetical protein